MSNRLTTEEFIQNTHKVHGNKYDYSKVNYKNNKTKIKVICSKHGEFLQKPNNHINSKQGCPICKSSKGEILISKILNNLNILYEQQKRFKDCINPLTKYKLSYDFYLPQENMLIEYNGEQHYIHKNTWYKCSESLENQQYRDKLKEEYAINNGYKFLVIKYDEDIEMVLRRL